jgi:hypothetical protein
MDHPAANQAANLVFLDFLGSEHVNHARHLFSFCGVDRLDRGMGMGAAHEIGIGLVLEVDVVGVLALAGNEPLVFLAQHARANSGVGHDTSLLYIFSAAD